jgi:hypothetical protein
VGASDETTTFAQFGSDDNLMNQTYFVSLKLNKNFHCTDCCIILSSCLVEMYPITSANYHRQVPRYDPPLVSNLPLPLHNLHPQQQHQHHHHQQQQQQQQQQLPPVPDLHSQQQRDIPLSLTTSVVITNHDGGGHGSTAAAFLPNSQFSLIKQGSSIQRQFCK